jgi:hypothetical protein
MNERIKELYNEACEDLDLTDDILQKFAKLIVKECASIAYRESCYSDPENVMGFDIAKKIEENFGVEE